MSEEKKDEINVEKDDEPIEGSEHRYDGHHGYGRYHRGHQMRRRMWMNFAFMSVEEEVELLESVKERLEKRLTIINERLAKLKA
ncbi:hypothetical protein FJY84_02595 [Candidatus Bathyarchaeota archaeon]|nr:hypothetical protein [Candidatus Bathyarchaeota archaeon]